MRDLLNLLQQINEAEEAGTADSEKKMKGLFPTELKKRENFALFINKINKGIPFTDNNTDDDVIIKRSEAARMQQLLDDGLFKGEKVTILTQDGRTINLGELRKTAEFGGSTKENLKLKPGLIKITDRDIPASDLYETIANNPVLQSTDYGQVVIQLAEYIVAGEYVQLPPEYLTKEKESERKAIVDYAGEYLGVLALLYQRSRFPRKQQFTEWLGGDLGEIVLNFPSAANNNIADSYATITNPSTSHSLNISSKGTGGGAAPAISGLFNKITPELSRNPKLKNAVALISLCSATKDATGPSTIVQAFKIMDFLHSVNPEGIPKEWSKYLPFSSKAPKLMQQCIDSINSVKDNTYLPLPGMYQNLISDINSEKASDGGKMVYKIKKVIAQLVNSKAVVPEFADTILQVLEMNFVQQYTDYHSNGELTFATQWPSKLKGVVTMENKSSAVEPSSAGFSFKLGRDANDYDDPGPDGEVGAPVIGAEYDDEVDQGITQVAEPSKVKKLSDKPDAEMGAGRSLRPKF